MNWKMDEGNEIDLQQFTENVSFLADCFDNSFAVQSSINYIKSYGVAIEGKKCSPIHKQYLTQKTITSSLSETNVLMYNTLTVEKKFQPKEDITSFNKELKNWGLPPEIVKKYKMRGIIEMFDWQVECLSNSKVLLESRNLVYSAPTSAGKTLVAEILAIKTILEQHKKVIIILPFVSIVREKMFYLQEILSSSGVRVEGYMGSHSPPGGFEAVHIAICTIEKANSLVNKLLDDGNITELGAVIVDELHLLGDPHRGYILELLLTKIKYISTKIESLNIQIVGMSATLPNLEVLANWLEAELYITEFRPIPLNEYCLVGNKYYDKMGKFIGLFEATKLFVEGDYVLSLCLETIKEGCSILIFCMTKNRCENLAQSISSSFYKLGCTDNEEGKILREQLKSKNILEVLEQLKNCPVGLDPILKNVISFGVAYHHAGLTFDERDIIEGAFRSGAIRVLVATSTLSSGVNLPARKVIIRSPVFQRQPINIMTYKQMIGRAGRMGKDVQGESVLICTSAEQKIGFELMMGTLDPVASCIENKDKFMRAILEVIASQEVCNKSELDLYTKCTLLYAQYSINTSQKHLLEDTLKELVNFELIRIQSQSAEEIFVVTPLGKACLSSSLAPNDGLSLFCEIQKARQCLVLESELHLIYLVTPYSVSSQWNDIDWLHLLTLWESLTVAMKRVGELVGVQESFIIRCLSSAKSSNSLNKLNIHKRFYTALALQDLVNEVPLSEVATKFQCARGFLQGLQQASATFAGMVTAFCRQLGWKNMEILISQFQDRLQFGIHLELLELLKLPSLNGLRARNLFDAGFETISSIASAEINVIENTLYKSIPFQSEKEREDDDDVDVRKRNKLKCIWITGCFGMTAREAAENLILEARKYLIQEIGVSEIKWKEVGVSEISSNGKYLRSKKSENINKDYDKDNEPHINIEKKSMEDNNNVLSCDKNTSIDCDAKNSLVESTIHPLKSNLNDTDNKIINVHIENCVDPKINEMNNVSNSIIGPLKEDIMWESLNFTETVFENIHKLRTSDIFISRNISSDEDADDLNVLDEVSNNDTLKKSAKDISLFSSDGDSSSLFEECSSLESIPNGTVKSDKSKLGMINKVETSAQYSDINSSSILNAFKSSLYNVNDDEDIKLVYEDDDVDDCNNIQHDKNIQEYEIINSQTLNETQLDKSLISPNKRSSSLSEDISQTLAKRSKSSFVKSNYDTDFKLNLRSGNSKNIKLDFGNTDLRCFLLRENDIYMNFMHMENATDVSIILDNNSVFKKSGDVIGSNIIINKPTEFVQLDKKEKLPIKGIALCIQYNICFYLDISSLEKISLELKCKLSRLFSKANLMMLCTKSNYVYLKKWLGIDLLSNCADIILAEWLLDSDERISHIVDLTKKYCDIDLMKTEININDKKKVFKDLETSEAACLKAWCVWAIAEKQNKVIMSKYSFLKEALCIETHVAKILGNCEYYGVTVDKNLASQLLIDVKSSQEILQKKAYKLCGYHFNFNSSKDVAKALGLYKGRRVSTKKSILSAHSSPIASMVIYWRKLNSILTKTLYPLTEQAFNYSADNRINPTYTMYTCTGRISMHEPNLQNVPRTFSIPLTYINMKDNAPCADVIEFNCRNIFKATPGHVFVSADYCQLEMRILTHYCKDFVLTRIMKSNVDVFKSIAASWSGIPEEQVDDDLRQKGKQLCYGILYGMGNRTLAQHLDVSELESAMFMDTFYRTYPGIKVFTQIIIEECKKSGYVETLMKRRRYIPDINSNVPAKRSSAERQAVNTTIQGSAADIAKAAMCAIDTHTNNEIDKPRLILQMHDELIYEVIESKKMDFIMCIKKLMEQTILNVPLPVKIKTGYTWGSMDEITI